MVSDSADRAAEVRPRACLARGRDGLETGWAISSNTEIIVQAGA